MIETWRQCVTAAGVSSGVAGEWFLAVGPFRGGGEIREVRFNGVTTTASRCEVSVVVSGGEERSAENFRAGSPIILKADVRGVAGQPSFRFVFLTYMYQEAIVPVAIRVDGGARFVLLGINVPEDKVLHVFCTATVIGFARMGANGLGVEDGLDR